METIPCPGCRTELGPEITACPICTRPRTKYEISRAYSALRAEQKRRRRLPFIVAAYLAGFGSIGWLGYKFRGPLRTFAASSRARFGRFVDRATDPGHLSSHPTEEPAAPQPSPSPSAAPEPSSPPPSAAPIARSPAAAGRPAVAPAVSKDGMAGARGPAPAGDLPLTAMDSSFQWALRGRVYDLLTLKPVPMISISVRGSNGMMGGFATDEYGRYLVILPRLNQDGYELVSTSPGYTTAVYYESDIPYAQLSASERRDMAENARGGDLHPTPLTDIIGEESIHRDIFVVPRR